MTSFGYSQDVVHAGESIFSIEVHANTSFRGSYLAASSSGETRSVKIEGAGPSTFKVVAAQLNVTVQKQTDGGRMEVEILKNGASVKRENTEAPYGVVGLASAVPPGGAPRQTTFEVTGSAKYAFLTMTSGTGETRQERVELPYSNEFYPKVGWIIALTAQKTQFIRPDPLSRKGEVLVMSDGIQGSLHVVIRVSGRILGEAETVQPFGLASAVVRLP